MADKNCLPNASYENDEHEATISATDAELAEFFETNKAILAAAKKRYNQAIASGLLEPTMSQQEVEANLNAVRDYEFFASLGATRSPTGFMHDPNSSATVRNLSTSSSSESVQCPAQPLRSQGRAWIPPANTSAATINDSLRIYAAQRAAQNHLAGQTSSKENSRKHPASYNMMSPLKGQPLKSSSLGGNGPEMPKDNKDTTMEDPNSDSDLDGANDNANYKDSDSEEDSEEDDDKTNVRDNSSQYLSSHANLTPHFHRGILWTPDNIRMELLEDQTFLDCNTQWTQQILSLDCPDLVPWWFRPYRNFFVDAAMRYLKHYGKDMNTLTVVDFGTAFMAVMSQEDIWADQIPPVMSISHWYTVAAELACSFPGYTILETTKKMEFFMTLMVLVGRLRKVRGLKALDVHTFNKDT